MSKIVAIVPNSKKSPVSADKEAIKKGIATRKMVKDRLDRQLERMQIENGERLIIAKRESGEENECELTPKEIWFIDLRCIRECYSHYNSERIRYQLERNEKKQKRMEMAKNYLQELIDNRLYYMI